MRQGSRLPLWRARQASFVPTGLERRILAVLRTPRLGGMRTAEVRFTAGLLQVPEPVVRETIERLQALGFAWSYDYGRGRHWTLAWEDFGGLTTDPYRPREWQPAGERRCLPWEDFAG